MYPLVVLDQARHSPEEPNPRKDYKTAVVTTTIECLDTAAALRPQNNDGETRIRSEPSWIKARVKETFASIKGYRTSIIIGLTMTTTSLAFSLTLLLWAAAKRPYISELASYVLWQTSYQRARKALTVAKFFANIFGTLIFLATGSCLGILLAPTAEEIDKAQRDGRNVHIGVTSLHNARRIRWNRAILGVVLLGTSLPLHLLYNSVFYITMPLNDYSVSIVSEDFLTGASYDISPLLSYGVNHSRTHLSREDNYLNNKIVPDLDSVLSNLQTTFSNTEPKRSRCSDTFDAYVGGHEGENGIATCLFHGTHCAPQPLMDSQHLLLVAKGSHSQKVLGTGFYTADNGFYGSPDIFCHNKWQYKSEFKDTYGNSQYDCPVSLWGPTWDGFEIASAQLGRNVTIMDCLSQSVEHTTLNVSRTILIVILSLSIVKIVCIASVLFFRGFGPMISIGDAVAHFLSHPDSFSPDADSDFSRTRSVSKKQVRLTALYCFSFMIMALVGSYALNNSEQLGHTAHTITDPVKYGQTGLSGFMAAVVTANIVQLFLTVQGFLLTQVWNGIIVCHSFVREHHHNLQGLRVSNPIGQQRKNRPFTVSIFASCVMPIIGTLLAYLFGLLWYAAVFTVVDSHGQRVSYHSIAVTDAQLAGALGLKGLIWVVQSIVCIGILIALLAYCCVPRADGRPRVTTNSRHLAIMCRNRTMAESNHDISTLPLRLAVLPEEYVDGVRYPGPPKTGFTATSALRIWNRSG